MPIALPCLSKAALQICKDQNFIPDVMHAHDWPTALVPVFLKTWDRVLSPLSSTASVLTIHNVGYQGGMTRVPSNISAWAMSIIALICLRIMASSICSKQVSILRMP